MDFWGVLSTLLAVSPDSSANSHTWPSGHCGILFENGPSIFFGDTHGAFPLIVLWDVAHSALTPRGDLDLAPLSPVFLRAWVPGYHMWAGSGLGLPAKPSHHQPSVVLQFRALRSSLMPRCSASIEQ